MNNETGLQGGLNRKLAILVAVILVVICLGLYGYSISKKHNAVQQQQKQSTTNPTGYQASAEQFIKYAIAKNGNASYNMFTDLGKKRVGSETDWQNTLNNSYGKTKGDPQFVSGTAIDDEGNVYKNQDPYLVIYRLNIFNVNWNTFMTVIKSGSSWKIDSVIARPTK